MDATGLELRGVRFGYGDWQVTYDLAVPSGSFTALLGASGAGKSTLLSLVAGFERPTAGAIHVLGNEVTDLAPSDRPVTTLFQEHNLFPHLTALQNIGLGIDPNLRLTRTQKSEIAAALERVGLDGMEARLPRELSGGERQRVAIARSLVRQRPLLLLDEPFAALGPALRRDMLDLVNTLRHDTGMTVVMVSHDPADARRVAEITAFLHDGAIAAVGSTATLLDEPDVPALAEYLGV